jgi:hypothetical protein
MRTSSGLWSRRSFVVASAIAGGTFVLIQTALAIYNEDRLTQAAAHGELVPFTLKPEVVRVLSSSIVAVATYTGAALAGLVIARRGHRILFAAPAAVLAFLPLIGAPHLPRPIGAEWTLTCEATCSGLPWFGSGWVGGTLDLALILVPGLLASRRVPAHRWRGVFTAPTVASLGFGVSLALLVDRTSVVVIGHETDVPALIAVAAFGFLAGARRWPWAHVIVALALTAGFLDALRWALVPPYSFGGYGYAAWRQVVSALEDAGPFVACALLVALWEPVARLLSWAVRRPALLVVAVNALNVVDAVLTEVAVRSGGAVELNPVVRIGGIPLKLALVGVLTWLLYRKRPRALLVPAVVLAWVVCYHLSGIIVNR